MIKRFIFFYNLIFAVLLCVEILDFRYEIFCAVRHRGFNPQSSFGASFF